MLDALSDRLMFRLAFRMFSDHEAIVVNHSVSTGGGNSGVRWYELRAPIASGGAFTLAQAGTYDPDSSYRWMGSAAMDQAGDIALGYSVSDSNTFPSVRYTGRTPSDPTGTMETEGVIMNGSGSQTGFDRWGDYSSLRIDPSDDCTFWYVNEYYPVTSSAGWRTRIGSFKFTGCSSAPDFALSATPGSRAISPGNSATSTIGVTGLNGYGGSVNLSVVSGCPANSTCTVSPGAASAGGTSTLTVSTAAATPVGTYTVTVKGVDSANASLVHNTTFTVTVAVADFSISANPAAFSVAQGLSNTSNISVGSLGGFTGPVTLSTGSTCPTGATCSFSVNPVTPGGSSTLTVTPSSTTPPAVYTVTVTGTSGSLTHSTTVTVTVDANFTMPSSLSLTVARGSSNSVSVAVGNVGTSTTSVTLSISGLPNGATASFSPNPVVPGSSSKLTVATHPGVKKGNYTLTITGSNGSVTHTTALKLTVN
jgi:hypothetical protein